MTDTTTPAATERPAPQRLLAAQLAATDEGGAQMTIHTRAADGAFYEGVLTVEPHVADMLRRAVVREIPDRPKPVATAQDLLQRMEGWFAPAPAATPRPPIICICGSTRFMDLMTEADLCETVAGHIVLKPGCDMKTPHSLWADPADADALKTRLDALHRAKIRMSDQVLVVGDYIGDSTRAEIAYARSLGIPVRFTHPHVDPALIPAGPTPEQAYRLAPPIADEIGWVAREAADWEDELDRTYYLRKAAVLDRIALRDDPDGTGPATQDAIATAWVLIDGEQAGAEEYGGAHTPDQPVITDPRAYVREQYLAWRRTDHPDA